MAYALLCSKTLLKIFTNITAIGGKSKKSMTATWISLKLDPAYTQNLDRQKHHQIFQIFGSYEVPNIWLL